MWTQRDQIQAYQFLRRRLVSALQTGDANHPVSPSRRVLAGATFGVAAAVLIAAGFGIYGVLRPGANQGWRRPGQVVIEKQSGATYVMSTDGRLHPVINYASARLLAGGDGTATVTVASQSLLAAPRGAPVGIVGAPDSLPLPTTLAPAPWAVCADLSRPRPSAAAAPTLLAIGVPVPGASVDARVAVLIRDDTDAIYLLTAGRRLRIRDNATLVALNYDTAIPVRVTRAWINAVPAGPDVALINIPGVGAAGPRVGDTATRVGQVLVSDSPGAGERYFLVRQDGLVAATQMQAALILNNPANRAAYPQGNPQPIRVSGADVVNTGQVRQDPPTVGYPDQRPSPLPIPGDRGALCVVTDPGTGNRIVFASAVPVPPGGKSLAVTGPREARYADEVYVPPGRGAVVREQLSPTSDIGTEYLITDLGVRYPIGSPEAAKALGYGAVRPSPVPASLLALLPSGPALDTTAAQRVVVDYNNNGP